MLSNMLAFFKSLIDHFRKLNELPDYFKAVKAQWVDVAWGVGMPAVIFIILWSMEVVKERRTIAYFFVWALFMAGYYLWRAYHIRLIPKFELEELFTPHTPTNAPNLERRFVQLRVSCITEGAVEECRGNLLEIRKWSAFHSAWEPTSVDEPVNLLWSGLNLHITTLESGLDRRINLFFIDTNRWLLPSEASVPLRAVITYAPGDIFRFHIRVAGKECPPQFAFIKATFGQNWDSIEVKEIKDGER